MSLTADAAKRVSLATLRDKFRPILVFAPTKTDPRFLDQARDFEDHRDDLRQRQVILVPVIPVQKHGAGNRALNVADYGEVTTVEATRIRARFHVAPADFTVILLGKDGGEKLRSHQPIRFSTLRDTIDSMPMRQQEMRHP